MRNVRVVQVFAIVALLLGSLAWLRPGTSVTYAAPLAVATEVPTSEPPTPVPATPVPATPVPPTAVPPAPTPRPVSPTTQVANPDPFVVKTASQGTVGVGEEISFTITIGNRGEAIARDVTVSDVLASELDVLSATPSRGTVSVSGQSVQLAIGDLAPGDQVTLVVRVRVTERAQPPGFVNSASVTTSTPGDDPGNNISTVYVGLRQTQPTPQPSPVAPTPAPVVPTPMPPASLPITGDGDTWVTALLAIAAVFGFVGLLARKYARYR